VLDVIRQLGLQAGGRICDYSETMMREHPVLLQTTVWTISGRQ
jgi:hypothetical protein